MANTFRARARRFANAFLGPLGLSLERRDRVFDLDGLLARARARGQTPATIIDVGASDGGWSLQARRHFPDARFVLFEPLAERQPALTRLHDKHGFTVIDAAAGKARGEIAFQVDAALDGSGVVPTGTPGSRTVRVEAIDDVVRDSRLPAPYALKLDTHGHEIPVLEGAARTLADTTLLIIEAYNFTLQPGCLRFHELCAWLEPRGFRCCDLAEPMRRPRDGVFWQADLAFARADDVVFTRNTYG